MLKVSDDGVGDKAPKPKTSGKGWQLIQDLASQLKAAAQIEQTALGTTWTIEPISVR